MEGESSRSQQRNNRITKRQRNRRRPSPTPPTSPELSPPDSPFAPRHRSSIHFPTEQMADRYTNDFFTRNVLLCKDYDFMDLNQHFNFTYALESANLYNLVTLPNETYEELVRIFFSNATTSVIESTADFNRLGRQRERYDGINTFIYNTIINVTPEFINTILNVQNPGARKPRGWDMSEAFIRVFGQPICEGETASKHFSHLRQHDFVPLARVFHHFIVYAVCPRSNINHVSVDDVFIINALLTNTAIDVGYIVVDAMKRAIGRKDSHLPYGRLITQILKFYGFDFSTHKKSIGKGKFTSTEMLRRLPISYDAGTQQYVRRDQNPNPQQAHQEGMGDFDLNLDALSLPGWSLEGEGMEGQWQSQSHPQARHGESDSFTMKDIIDRINELQTNYNDQRKIFEDYRQENSRRIDTMSGNIQTILDQQRLLFSHFGIPHPHPHGQGSTTQQQHPLPPGENAGQSSSFSPHFPDMM